MTDVLKKLLADGRITAADYYGRLLLLRRSNVRYLPLDADEILFHLRQAQVTDGVAAETDELAALRRYVAACLTDGENLQKSPQPAGSSNPSGEINFVFETTAGVVDAMAALWGDETLRRKKLEGARNGCSVTSTSAGSAAGIFSRTRSPSGATTCTSSGSTSPSRSPKGSGWASAKYSPG